jgi:protein SCO1/2
MQIPDTQALYAALLLALAPAAALPEADPHAHHRHVEPAAAPPSVVTLEVPDLVLLDQDGQPRRFRSDVIGDRLAAITFTYTSCTTVCPILDRVFLDLQQRLQQGLSADTALVTVTIDPANDIPTRLRAHADKVGATEGWRFLTGDSDRVVRLLKALEVYSGDIFDHPPTVYVVDGERDLWTRLNGFPSGDAIVRVLDGYRDARTAH